MAAVFADPEQIPAPALADGGCVVAAINAPGQTVLDEHVLTFEGLPAEDWTLAVGLYDAATGERVPVTTAGLPVQDDAVLLKLDD